MPKFKAPTADAAVTTPAIAVETLPQVEFQEAYEFDGKEIPSKFIIETSKELFSIATSRCDDDPLKMIAMVNAGAFQLATDKESGEPITNGDGKLVYSVPFKKDRVATGAKLSTSAISVAERGAATDKYASIVVTVTPRRF